MYDEKQKIYNFPIKTVTYSYQFAGTIETDEHDIIDRFVAQKYIFVTLGHLFPAIKMFLFGLMLDTCVFFVELATHSFVSHYIVE